MAAGNESVNDCTTKMAGTEESRWQQRSRRGRTDNTTTNQENTVVGGDNDF